MRNREIPLIYLTRAQYNEILERKFNFRSRIKETVFAKIIKPLEINDSGDLADLAQQEPDLSALWVPDAISREEFALRKHESSFYDQLFSEALLQGKLIANYKFRLCERDSFVFMPDGEKLVMHKLFIAKPNFGSYDLYPGLPEDSKNKRRLMGVLDREIERHDNSFKPLNNSVLCAECDYQ